MSRNGCCERLIVAEHCYDNAVTELSFWSLKHEWTRFDDFANINQARSSVFQYIETLCTSKRIHHTLDFQTPDEFEETPRTKLAA